MTCSEKKVKCRKSFKREKAGIGSDTITIENVDQVLTHIGKSRKLFSDFFQILKFWGVTQAIKKNKRTILQRVPGICFILVNRLKPCDWLQ